MDPDSLRERKRRFLGERYADDPDGVARYYYDQAVAGGRTSATFTEWRYAGPNLRDRKAAE